MKIPACFSAIPHELVPGMSILKYFKQKDGLPEPRGELSTSVRPSAIARANKEVEEEMAAAGKTRGPYRR